MAIQDQNEDSPNSVLETGNRMLLDVDSHSEKGVQLQEQFPSGNDYAPKVRKPYTITKQRERWTEEEHKKFIDALKLYGRAWRRIEEHVGTKTAVQIRSHAQKFFSKVVRESSNNDTSSIKPIEIPPPRPKRKPMHPYPRKVVAPLKTGNLVPEQPRRSISPIPITEQENQSPTSVLSAIGSEILGGADSNTPNGSPSQISSAFDINPCGFSASEGDSSLEENGPPLQVHLPADSSHNEQVPVKLELFPQDNSFLKEGSAEAASVQSLKLFGKTVLVTDSHRPTSSAGGTCKSSPSEINDARLMHASNWNFTHGELSSYNAEGTWSPLPSGAPQAFYCVQFPKENSNPPEAASGHSVPWWAFCGGMPFSWLSVQNMVPQKTQEREVQKEGSWSGSNSGSENAEDGDRNWESETGSKIISETEQKPKLPGESSEKAFFSEQRVNSSKCQRGFVPYKRCLAERERERESSTMTTEDREEQRIRLCL